MKWNLSSLTRVTSSSHFNTFFCQVPQLSQLWKLRLHGNTLKSSRTGKLVSVAVPTSGFLHSTRFSAASETSYLSHDWITSSTDAVFSLLGVLITALINNLPQTVSVVSAGLPLKTLESKGKSLSHCLVNMKVEMFWGQTELHRLCGPTESIW